MNKRQRQVTEQFIEEIIEGYTDEGENNPLELAFSSCSVIEVKEALKQSDLEPISNKELDSIKLKLKRKYKK